VSSPRAPCNPQRLRVHEGAGLDVLALLLTGRLGLPARLHGFKIFVWVLYTQSARSAGLKPGGERRMSKTKEVFYIHYLFARLPGIRSYRQLVNNAEKVM